MSTQSEARARATDPALYDWFAQQAPPPPNTVVPTGGDARSGPYRPPGDVEGRPPSPPGTPVPTPTAPGSAPGHWNVGPGGYQQPGAPVPGGPPRTYQEAQQAFNQLFPGETLTPQMLQEHQAELEALGFKLRPNAAGVVGKIQWGNEPIVDVIQGAGSGLNRKQWLVGDGSPGGGAAGGLGIPGAFGYMVEPWKEQFQARDPNQIRNDPAYQFQLKEGLRGVQSGAAAKGTLLTGGTLKALEGYGQGLADTFEQKYYNRDLGEYGLRRENFYGNQDRPFDKFFRTATLGKPNP